MPEDPTCYNYWAFVLQLLKPTDPEHALCKKRSPHNEKPENHSQKQINLKKGGSTSLTVYLAIRNPTDQYRLWKGSALMGLSPYIFCKWMKPVQSFNKLLCWLFHMNLDSIIKMKLSCKGRSKYHTLTHTFIYISAQSCPTLSNPMDYSTPGLPVHHQLPELAQTHVHQVSDTIQPSHPLSPLLLLASIFPSIRVFYSESIICIR